MPILAQSEKDVTKGHASRTGPNNNIIKMIFFRDGGQEVDPAREQKCHKK
jgi:hypothetical protein